MPSSNQYLPLSALISVDDLPEAFNFLEGGISTIFDNIYFRGLQKFEDNNSSRISVQIIIATPSLSLTMPGNFFTLWLNEPPGNYSNANSEFPIAIEVEWGILKYVKDFNISSFASSGESFIKIAKKIFPADDEHILVSATKVFASGSLQQLISDANSSGLSLSFTYNTGLSEGENASNYISYLRNSVYIEPWEVILGTYFLTGTASQILDKAKELLNQLIYGDKNGVSGRPSAIKIIESLFRPKIKALAKVTAGIDFSRDVLIPVKPDGSIETDTNVKTRITFGEIDFFFNTHGKIGFDKNLTVSFDSAYPSAQIGNTGLGIGFINAKLDLSRETNIPEATADGRPNDFIGAFIEEATITLPEKWFKDRDTSEYPPGYDSTSFPPSPSLKGKNLLIGTGGISGTISFDGAGVLYKKLGNIWIGLDEFSLTFHQNAITNPHIKGTIIIPGFTDGNGDPVVVHIIVDIRDGGEFKITASTDNAIPVLKCGNVFNFEVKELYVGRQSEEEGGKFYIGVSGAIDLLLQDPIGKFLPDKIDIKKLLIYEDGDFEIEGGSIVLPKAFELQLGPAKIGITAIHLGSYEKGDRKYKYFGFDGGVNVNPGGVDARGKGIKYYYSVDGQDFDWFIRLESLAIDIIIPGDGDKDDAAVIIEGFLSIKDPVIPTGTTEPLLSVLKNSTEYAGGVHLAFPKMKGLEASASMRMNPQVPSFIIDLGLELSTPILLGSTGLGIYGFRGLFGKKYVATKEAAGIPEDGEWWQYYKAKIDPDYLEGIQVSKFSIKNGFSFGAGISLATSSDSGKTFSSKLFVMLCLPDVLFMFQGQAAILKDRIGLNANPDPPFFALIVISKHSVEAGFGVNYKIPEDTGKVIAVEGVIEMGFFWGSSSAWYVNIGRDQPEDRRITARVFDVFDMYTYFMISNNGIRAGAGINLEFKKTFGPLSAELSAYFDVSGQISFRPKQIGGAIQIGGTASLSVCGVGFGVSANATLVAEASHPKIITGTVEACAKILRKERCAHFEFTWQDETDTPTIPNPVLIDIDDSKAVASASNIVTGETFPVQYFDATSVSSVTSHLSELPIIPMDSYIDIEFKKGMNVTTGINVDKIGGLSSPCEFVEFVPPIRGASNRVQHEYKLSKIKIWFYDANASPASWKDYNFYDALIPLFSNGDFPNLIDTDAIQDMKWGYWQQQRPGFNNKLKILATSPLTYLATKGDSIIIEDLGINANTILCGGPVRPITCVTFDSTTLYRTYQQGQLHHYKNILFKITSHDGIVLNLVYDSIPNGLCLTPGDKMELFFKVPMKLVKLRMQTGAPNVKISYFRRCQKPHVPFHLPVFEFVLIEEVIIGSNELENEIAFSDNLYSIDYIVVETSVCEISPEEPPSIVCISKEGGDEVAEQLRNFLSVLVERDHLTGTNINLNDPENGGYEGVYMNTLLYTKEYTAEMPIILEQGYISKNLLLFSISDSEGFNCNYSLELMAADETAFDFTLITSIVSLSPYTAGSVAGTSTSFVMEVGYMKEGDEEESFTMLIGSSCLPLSYCYNSCSTFVYKICYLSAEDDLVNQTIPAPEIQQANNQVMFDSINKTLQPIWRPNTAFAIEIETIDNVGMEGDSSTPHATNAIFAFRTAGPIGHFHNYLSSLNVQTKRPEYLKLEDEAHEAEFKLASLKEYIDYVKSYPNADGDIINAKPLFYRNAKLKLFYLYNFVYEFYSDWVDYSNNPTDFIAKSKLSIEIKDPLNPDLADSPINYTGNSANNIINNPAQFVPSNINHEPLVTNGVPSNIHSLNNDIAILNNMLNYMSNQVASPCVPSPPSLTPIDISSERILNLRPMKMYTAQFIASYQAAFGGTLSNVFKEVVHSYVFQTSRYPNFTAQVNSYILKKNSSGAILKAAIYAIDAGDSPSLDLALAHRVITDALISTDESLQLQFADQFDRLINGVLHINYNDLQVPVTTEFNIIKDPTSPNNILGILIQSPEPFNNPRIPRANPNNSSNEPTETLIVQKLTWMEEIIPQRSHALNTEAVWGDPSEYYVIHSKDRSRIFVTNRNFNFNISASAILKLTFKYKTFDGLNYTDETPVNVLLKLNNYTF